ncbi:MAG: protein translocase subunit SecD [Deltaproteobacteria bacterium]|jgi:preprotein translocase subunit SecD|nr:protein translocase subunit SecD [Deltaproteobacteria bacterium]
MNHNLLWRGILLALVLGAGIICVLPTFLSSKGETPSFLPSKVINLGLDLKGGIYLLMEVDMDVALINSCRRTGEDLRASLSKAGVPGVSLETNDSKEIKITLQDDSYRDQVTDLIDDLYPNLRITQNSERNLTLQLTSDEEANIKDMTARQALETIRNRVDEFGVAEPDIRPQGEDRILIQLPGFSDPERAVDLIGRTAVLEFKLVYNGPITPEEAIRDGAPPGTQVYKEKFVNPLTGKEDERPIILMKTTLLTGETLTDARAYRGDMGDPRVSIRFDSRGARYFADITEQYQGRRLAIVLDDMVYSAPTIRSRIPDGDAYIDKISSIEEARMLAVVLRAGALPAPVTILEERTVGPSLGEDSIKQGFTAGIVGLTLILLFLLFYYRWSGLAACLALLINFPLVLGALAVLGATLTLPGIFGLVLTFAMAVDANVLIFERIREEIRQGRSPSAAINGGFGRAFWTIFDANITTILAAMVLYQFGTGPIRGFAITLILGILSSMFTAIFASRWMFDLVLAKAKPKRVSI